jgi:hypothetical protein
LLAVRPQLAMLAGSPLPGFLAASLMRFSMASLCASKTTFSVS